MPVEKDLVAASATPIVLSILSRGESYGYEIIKHVKSLSDGEMTWTDGMLYPVLHRLERQRLIRSEWRISETGRRRKYYFVQKAGLKALKDQREQWLGVYKILKRAGAKICST